MDLAVLLGAFLLPQNLIHFLNIFRIKKSLSFYGGALCNKYKSYVFT